LEEENGGGSFLILTLDPRGENQGHKERRAAIKIRDKDIWEGLTAQPGFVWGGSVSEEPPIADHLEGVRGGLFYPSRMRG